jgi:hypothetical protein
MAQAARLQQRPQLQPRQQRRPRYYSVIGGRGYWQPNKQLRALGFRNVTCGEDSPEARAIAEAMNRQATAARLTADAARAVADAGSSKAVYGMLGAFTEVNAKHLHRQQSEKFEPQKVEYRPLVRLQTQQPTRWLEWLRAAFPRFHAARG